MEGGTDGASYNVSPNGWMGTEQFADWFERVYVPHIKGIPGNHLLLLDGHSSHLVQPVIILSREHNVSMLCFPSHSTHLLQPQDVGVFSPA